MNTPAFHVERADWDRDLGALRAVREAVFIEEQRVPVELEWDDLDARSDHMLARDASGQAIGTGRLTPERKIGRMAVLADWRGHGVGSALLTALIDRARERGWLDIELHAQVAAMAFYAGHGFEPWGEEFDEAGIRHQRMRRRIEPHTPPPAERGTPVARPPAQPFQFNSRASALAALLEVIQDARHALQFQTHNLDPALLDDDAVLEALRRVASSNRGASLRFLLHDPAEVLRRGHRLIALAQRLPSRFAFRQLIEDEPLAYPSAFVLNDVGGYLFRPLASRFDGRGDRCAPGEAAPLANWFEESWNRAQPAAELRPLDL
ncbi:MAG TPA: GNAT family N-acetyltransferase [Rhodanobacteraceae bacterium]|nr:GNAT family N-acetyltransferase [Rhodanobacteraceae bacterium]